MVKIFGFDSLDSFLQTPVADLYQESADRALFVSELEKSGSVKDSELKMKMKDGKPIWISCSAKAVY